MITNIDAVNEVKRVAFMYTTNDDEYQVIQSMDIGVKLKDADTGDVYTVVDVHISGVLADRYIKRKFISYKDIVKGLYVANV